MPKIKNISGITCPYSCNTVDKPTKEYMSSLNTERMTKPSLTQAERNKITNCLKKISEELKNNPNNFSLRTYYKNLEKMLYVL